MLVTALTGFGYGLGFGGLILLAVVVATSVRRADDGL